MPMAKTGHGLPESSRSCGSAGRLPQFAYTKRFSSQNALRHGQLAVLSHLQPHWRHVQFGTQQLTVGWIKMLKSEADKLCTHSGQHGIFLNLQDAINVQRNIQWFTREPQESIDSYFRKSSKTAQDKKKPLLYRKGGKHNLGMEVDSDTAASFQRKIIARGLPKEWDKHEFLANNMAATGLNGFSRAPQPLAVLAKNLGTMRTRMLELSLPLPLPQTVERPPNSSDHFEHQPLGGKGMRSKVASIRNVVAAQPRRSPGQPCTYRDS